MILLLRYYFSFIQSYYDSILLYYYHKILHYYETFYSIHVMIANGMIKTNIKCSLGCSEKAIAEIG